MKRKTNKNKKNPKKLGINDPIGERKHQRGCNTFMAILLPKNIIQRQWKIVFREHVTESTLTSVN